MICGEKNEFPVVISFLDGNDQYKSVVSKIPHDDNINTEWINTKRTTLIMKALKNVIAKTLRENSY